MATFKPLLIFMTILIGIFLIINLFISPVYDPDQIEVSESTESLINVIDEGWDLNLPLIEDATIKPISYLYFGSETVETFLINQITYLSLFPSVLLTPILILLIGSLGWAIIILIKDMIPFT